MPPRPTQDTGLARGRGGGAGRPPRGSPVSLTTGRGAHGAGRGGQPPGSIPAHVRTVGVKRPGYGINGKKVTVLTNACEAKVPEGMMYHYDIAILPENKILPPRFTMQLIKQLQLQPEFDPIGAYDGKKNLVMPHEINFGRPDVTSREYDVVMNGISQPRDRPPKVYKIRVTKVAEINPDVLQRFLDRQQTQDEQVLTVITFLNIIIRMFPIQNHPFNVRSFFTDTESRAVGCGFELWRGYFQSIRPASGTLLLNVDLSTGMFYKSGPLILVALEVLKAPSTATNALNLPAGPPRPLSRPLKELEKYLKGVRVSVQPAAPGSAPKITTISGLTLQSAADMMFEHNGRMISVAQYFQQAGNAALQYPRMVCAKTASGAALPFERCTIVRGQIARKQMPPEVTAEMVKFSTKRPADRLASIRNSFPVLAYGQSEYIRNFGLSINEGSLPMSIEARQLPAPQVMYGNSNVVQPNNGSWNMAEKKLFTAETINRWAVVVFESLGRLPLVRTQGIVGDFIGGCTSVGIQVHEARPVIEYGNSAGDIRQALLAAGAKCIEKHRKGPDDKDIKGPDMLLVIVPDAGNADIYRKVKHFGDVTQGVVTQCLKASKCSRANLQYWANVCLKLNVKLGGVNCVPGPKVPTALSDPRNPTIIMGADVMHPAPGSDTPSFSALVGSVDSRAVKYIPRTSVQLPRQEIISDLHTMAKEILTSHLQFQIRMEKKSVEAAKPKRLLFFRDGVSEGQFGQVMEQEVEVLKKVCVELGIAPKITFIIVGKRHHYRFFPKNPDARQEADKSGNCPAGTVVDKGITHPLLFDFYIQSHGGLLGTSRSAHYSVLYDDNNFIPDELQALCYLLCYIYARATRSVSIPAPVYYADIVCSRAKNHYTPDTDLSDAGSNVGDSTVQRYMDAFQPLHATHLTKMYFM